MTTFVVVASGPSLTREDVEYCRDKAKVIVVNDCYRLAPWADICYASDYDWYRLHINAIRNSFFGRCVTVDVDAAAQFGVEWIQGQDGRGLSRDRSVLHTGRNSTHAAVNYAYHLGAKKIILLGVDMGATGTGHWFGDHPKELNSLHDYPMFMDFFASLAEDLLIEGVDVVNCTRKTALRCFRQGVLKDEL